MARRKYKMHTLPSGHRVRIVLWHGCKGYESKFTTSCSGCFEAGENMGRAGDYPYDSRACCYVGAGCAECGYTGKRRQEHWVPLNGREHRKHEKIMEDMYLAARAALAVMVT